MPYINPAVAGDPSIHNMPFSSLWPALIHIFPSLLAEHHGYSQGQADQPHCGGSQGPQQQDHNCGGWPGWDGLCYQCPWKGTAQGQCALQAPAAVMLCTACLS